MISILAITIVFFIAVSNVEDAPLRKPFPTQGADSAKVLQKSAIVAEDDSESKTPDTTKTTASLVISNSDKIDIVNTTISEATPEEKPSNTTDLLVKNVNSEALTMAGLKNFVVKPQPFNGKLFDQFDLSMLSYLNIIDKNVIVAVDGNEKSVLRIYEFELPEKSQNQEVYDFLRAKLKDELEVKVNETNQFGLSSFFINFNEPKDDAFLVVKTRTNVYALSYPKAKGSDKSSQELVSKLLLELI